VNNCTVIGLGKIGLPLAVSIAESGYKVTGLDINPKIVDKVNLGEVPVGFDEPGLGGKLKNVVAHQNLIGTVNASDAIKTADVIVVIVPLTLNSEGAPAFEALDSVTRSIGENLKKGSLIVYETTLPIGTTRNRFNKMISAISGFKDSEYFMAFSPERVFVGAFFETLRNVPKIVGGVNAKSAQMSKKFYESFIPLKNNDEPLSHNRVIVLESSEAAEFAKLAETTYRDVNIALANTFAKHAYQIGVNVSDIIQACNSQPYSFIHNPGIFVGGHCIPVYPKLYSHTDKSAVLVDIAREINSGMPDFYIEQLMKHFGSLKEVKVQICGVSYRKGVKETYHSGIFDLNKKLSGLGAFVKCFDNNFTKDEITALGLSPVDENFLPEILIFQTDEPSFNDLSIETHPSVKYIIDGRAFLDKGKWPEITIMSLGTSLPQNSPVLNRK
jgi:nucleotide sugar dehydrogenase